MTPDDRRAAIIAWLKKHKANKAFWGEKDTEWNLSWKSIFDKKLCDEMDKEGILEGCFGGYAIREEK